MKRIFCLLFALLLACFPISAQEEINTPWPVEQRCVGEPTSPPEGWTFPGEILMTGHYGIHAVSASLDTPYVVAFIRWDKVLYGRTALSPDKKWVALLEGYDLSSNPYSAYATGQLRVTGIRVYRVGLPVETHFVPLESFIDYAGGQHPTGDTVIKWIDNHSFAVLGWKVDSFSGMVSEVEDRFYYLTEGIEGAEYPSPDWTRNVFVNRSSRLGRSFASMYGTDKDDFDSLDLALATVIEWTPDSAYFAAEIPVGDVDEDPPQQLALFDRDGKAIDVVFEPRNVGGERLREKRWSNNGRYLAFLTYPGQDENYDLRLYIADFENHIVIDTCREITHNRADSLFLRWSPVLAWSPDNSMLTLIDVGAGQHPLMVLDLEAWQLYTVAYHNGEVIGWR